MLEFEPQSWIMEMTPEMTLEISDPTEISDSMEIGERDLCLLTHIKWGNEWGIIDRSSNFAHMVFVDQVNDDAD